MPICAIVDEKTGEVQGTIIADPVKDKPYPGTLLVLIEQDEDKGAPVDGRWIYSKADGLKPGPALAAKMLAEPAEYKSYLAGQAARDAVLTKAVSNG